MARIIKITNGTNTEDKSLEPSIYKKDHMYMGLAQKWSTYRQKIPKGPNN